MHVRNQHTRAIADTSLIVWLNAWVPNDVRCALCLDIHGLAIVDTVAIRMVDQVQVCIAATRLSSAIFSQRMFVSAAIFQACMAESVLQIAAIFLGTHRLTNDWHCFVTAMVD